MINRKMMSGVGVRTYTYISLQHENMMMNLVQISNGDDFLTMVEIDAWKMGNRHEVRMGVC